MFPVDVIQSQGDKDLQIESIFNSVEDQHLFSGQDSTDFQFLDSVIEKSEPSFLDWQETNMNMDLKELLTSVLPEETMDISSLLDFNNDFSSELSATEQSYNLNSFQAVSVGQTQCQDAESCENSYSEEVSSTASMTLDMQEEIDLLDSTLADVLEKAKHDVNKPHEVNESIAGKKYMEMRRKNNIASQRSRKIRKQKNVEMTTKLKILEKENRELLLLSEKLEKERDALQKRLMSIIVKK